MLSLKQQKALLELLIKKQLRPKDFKFFCNDSDTFRQLRQLRQEKFIYRVNGNENEVFYRLTEKGAIFTKLLALTEERYKSCVKEEIIEFVIEP